MSYKILFIVLIKSLSAGNTEIYNEMEQKFQEKLSSTPGDKTSVVERQIALYCHKNKFVKAAYFTLFAATKLHWIRAQYTCQKALEAFDNCEHKSATIKYKAKKIKNRIDAELEKIFKNASNEPIQNILFLTSSLIFHYENGGTLYSDEDEGITVHSSAATIEEISNLCEFVSSDDEEIELKERGNMGEELFEAIKTCLGVEEKSSNINILVNKILSENKQISREEIYVFLVKTAIQTNPKVLAELTTLLKQKGVFSKKAKPLSQNKLTYMQNTFKISQEYN